MAFTGLPEDGITFYEQLTADNSKAFWTANKDRYTTSVWIHTKQVEKRIRDCWAGASDMNAWLDAHVDPAPSRRTTVPSDRISTVGRRRVAFRIAAGRQC